MGKIKSLLKLLPVLKEYRLILITGIIGLLLSSLLMTPIPYIIGRLLDKVLMGSRSYRELYIYIAIIAAFYLTYYILSFTSKKLFVRINNAVVNDMRFQVMKKVMNLPMSYLANTEKGYIQGRIAECNSVGSLFSPTIAGMLFGVITAVFAVISMFIINFKLAFIVMLMTPFFFFTSKASSKEFMKNTKSMMESNAVLSGESFEILNGIEDIKVLNGKDTHLNKFKQKIDELVKFSMKQSKSMIMLMENISLINEAGGLIILLVSGILIIKGHFTIGLYTSFSLYSTKVFGSTLGLATLSTSLKPVFLSIERIYELMDMEEENSGRNLTIEDNINHIQYEQVGFRYKDELPEVFENIVFSLHRGSKVLVKGDNGSGKTTLLKLLLGLYQPTSGKIIIDGRDIKTINCDSLRRHIGIVSQNIFLFRGTVIDNILYGQNIKDRNDVEQLIRALSLEDYVNRLPKGLDTDISQNTTGISGGQTQIIAFIRAILSDKDIIILDEPVSNVDEETHNLIISILKNYIFQGILIVISHQSEGLDFFTEIIEL